jgi:hypothetical protein
MRHVATGILALTLSICPLTGQDRFPLPIPSSPLVQEVLDVAVVPDSSPNQPPRLSVLTQDPGGRLFVNDQRGPLYTFNESTGEVIEYLDIRDYPDLQILSTFEAGFQGFAFHPEFLNEGSPGFGRFYTIHSSSNTSGSPDFNPGGNTSFHTLLLEWHTNVPSSGTFVPANPGNPYRELMRLKQPFGNHNAGLIAFNPLAVSGHSDYGNLYISIGDGGSGGDPQENGEDPSNPFGAILRIDPLGTDSTNGNYGIVPGNLLAADGNPSTLAEIYCYGLRNPQRFAWDIVTGNCYIADIGQNAVEEINLAANGANYGWDIREGSFSFEGGNTNGLTDPVAEYDHFNTVSNPPTSINNRAVTTGEVARGTCTQGLDGHLLLADFPTGLIFLLDVDSDPLDGGQDGLSELLLHEGDGIPVRLLDLINAVRGERNLSPATRTDLRFSVNTPGRIYLTNKQDGVVRRLRPDSPPSAGLANSGNSGPEVQFKGILQSSPDLSSWEDVLPQPDGSFPVNPGSTPSFFRSVRR